MDLQVRGVTVRQPRGHLGIPVVSTTLRAIEVSGLLSGHPGRVDVTLTLESDHRRQGPARLRRAGRLVRIVGR